MSRPVEEHKEEDVVKPTFTALVIAYAERIECFMQYLKKQPEGNSLGINKKEDPAQEHYSIVMDVILDEKIEKIEIIYIKYQDNVGFGGFTAGDAKYAFIGGDLYDKQDVRDFLVNCGVTPEHSFVTPCAYNIDAAGASGETDCQKRKFKKSIFKRLSNAMFKSDEKTPIAADKNKFDYNVDFFNEIVRNNETKQCIARPFIMLQFPLFICWSYEYYTGGAQNIETTKQELINMFKASSSISNSLLESLRIPATHMFENKPDVDDEPVDENMAQQVPSVARNDFDLGSNTVHVETSKQYKIDNATNDSFTLFITKGDDAEEKTFTKGRCYKNVGGVEDANLYLLESCIVPNAQKMFAVFYITQTQKFFPIVERMYLDDSGTNFNIKNGSDVPKQSPIITNELLENLKQIKYKIDSNEDGFDLTITKPGPESNDDITLKEFKINRKYTSRRDNFIYKLVNDGQNSKFEIMDANQKVGDIVLTIDAVDSHLKVTFTKQNYGYIIIAPDAITIETLGEFIEPAVVDQTIIETATNLPSALPKTYEIEKINDTQIKLMIITQGNIKTEKIFTRGETYKTTNSAKLYKLGAITEARATFKITNAGENDVIEIIVFGELSPAPVVTDIHNKPKDNPTITMDLLENLEKNEQPSLPPSNVEPTTTTTEDPHAVIKKLIETDSLTYQNIKDAINVLNTMTLDGAQESIKITAIMYYNRLEELEQLEQNPNNDAEKTTLLQNIKGLLMMIANPTPIPAQPTAQPSYKINIPDDLKSFSITENASGSNNTITFEVGKTYIFKNDPNTFSSYSNRSFKLESIAQNGVDGASEKMIKFIDSVVGKLSNYNIYVDANGVPKMGDKIQISQILFFPALFNLTEMSEVALKFMTQAQPAIKFSTTPTNTFSRANLGVSSPRSEAYTPGTAAVEETKEQQPDNTVNDNTVQSIGLCVVQKGNLEVSVSMFASYCNSILDFPDDGNKLDDFYILSALTDEHTDFKIIDTIAENGNAQNKRDRLSKHVFHKVDSMPPNGITLVSVQPPTLTDPHAKKEDIAIASETFYKYNELYSFKLKNVDTNQITLEIFLSGDHTVPKQEYKINLKDGLMLEYNYQLLSRLYENNKNKNGQSVSAPEPASINFESVVPEQDGASDLVGFGSKTNNNNCYLNAMFQMLCRVKGLKQELTEKLIVNQIAKTKKSVNGGVQVEYNNPTYEIATIFKKYDDASRKSSQTKMATSVNVETENVLGMKSFASNSAEATRDTQHSIIEFLIKGVFCEDDATNNCEFANHLYTNKHDFFAVTLNCINKDAEIQLLEDEGSIADEDKQQIQAQLKRNVIFHFNRVGEQVVGDDGKTTIPKIQTSLIAPNTLKIGASTYFKKGAIVHLGTGSGSGHYLYISYKTLSDGRVVIDKIYNNENILVFNNNAGKPYLAKSQSQSSEGLEFFLNSITAIIDDVTAQQKDNKNIFITKLGEAASEIIDSDILSLAQYDDVNNKLDVIRFNIQFNFDIFCNVSKQQIVEIFKYSQFNEILSKDINQIDEEVSRNATYFLYELATTATVGGASKKKSWSRSRRAKKHTNVSLKRLNKMKRESHPSIKKRTTSLKK